MSRIGSRIPVCHLVVPACTSTSVTVPKWSDTTKSPPAAPGVTPDSNDDARRHGPAFGAGGEVAGDDACREVAVPLAQHDHAVMDHRAVAPASTPNSHRTATGREVEDAQAVHGLAHGAGPEHGPHGVGLCPAGGGSGPDVAGQLHGPTGLAGAAVEGGDQAALGGHERDRLEPTRVSTAPPACSPTGASHRRAPDRAVSAMNRSSTLTSTV